MRAHEGGRVRRVVERALGQLGDLGERRVDDRQRASPCGGGRSSSRAPRAGAGGRRERPITSVRSSMRPSRLQRLLRRRGGDLGADVEQHQQVAQVGGEERHLVGAGDQDPVGGGDRLDRALDLRARDLARRVLDVDVVGGDGLLERRLVEREQRRGVGSSPARLRRSGGGGGGTPRARPPGAPGSPRSRAPARSARRSTTTCSRGGRAPPRCGRRPRRDGRRRTARRPSGSARTRRSARRCTRKGLVAAGGRAAWWRSSAWRGDLSTARALTSSPICSGFPPDSTDSSCSRPPCTATSAASSWRPCATTRGPRTASRRRSCRTTTRARAAARVRGIHFQTHPGQGKLVRVRARRACSTSSSTCGAARRPSASGRASSSTTSTGRQLWIPVGFGHGFCVLCEIADFVYKCTNYYDPATEAGIRFDDPEVGIEWPADVELLYSRARPRRAAAGRGRRLAAVHGVSDGRFAPCPTGVLHLGNLRTALLAWLFARSAGSRVPGADGGPRHGARAAGLGGASSWPTWPRSGSTGTGEVVCQSARAGALRGGAVALRCERRLYECFCTRAEIREAASAAHGPLPEGAYPGTCLRADARPSWREQRRVAGAPPALRVRAGGRVVAFEDRLLGPQSRASSTTSSCAATTARSPTTSRSSSTTRRRASRRSSAAPTSSTPRRASSGSRGRSGCPSRPTRTCRSCSAPTARRLAKRHGDVTLREVGADAALAWMAASLGFAGRTAQELLADVRSGAAAAAPTPASREGERGRPRRGLDSRLEARYVDDSARQVSCSSMRATSWVARS